MTYFKSKLQQIMNERGLKQTDIAKLAKVSQNTISMWLKKSQSPNSQKLETLAKALNISVGELIGDFGGNAQLTEDDKRWLALSPKHKKFLLKVLDAMQESEE